MTKPPGATIAAIVATFLAVAAMSLAAFAPLQRSVSVSVDSEGGRTTSSKTRSLFETEGPAVLVVTAIPVAVVAFPLLALGLRRQRLFRVSLVVATSLLAVFVLATGFSIGLLYVPALAALAVAAVLALGSGGRSAESV